MENGIKKVKLQDGGSVFEGVPMMPPDAVFHVNDMYNSDPDLKKVNLSIGAYRTDELKPWVLPVVRTVEAQMSGDPTLNHEYLPLDGLKSFLDLGSKMVLGDSSIAITQDRVCAVQALSGTGSLRLGFAFLKKYYPSETVLIPSPTWSNHNSILEEVGYADVRRYRYYLKDTRGLDFEGMIEDIKDAPEGSVLLLHACAHNPTGIDPTKEQWRRIMTLCKERKLFVFFDSAYIGFATGDVDGDAWALREFVNNGMEFFTAISFSKNFGLYNERAGMLISVVKSPEIVTVLRSQLKVQCRRMWSNPPNHGCRIVATVLGNPSLYLEWRDNLTTMAERIKQMRQELYTALKAIGTPGTWEHIINQTGMFSYTGLTSAQVEFLASKYHIYMLKSGRVSMCGLNSKNIDYVAAAIKDAVITYPEQ